jgi:hypothetical protein
MWRASKAVFIILFAKEGFSAQILITDARLSGAGGGFVSVADGCSAILTNPAGLSEETTPNILFSYATDRERGDFWGMVYPGIREGCVGVGFVKTENKRFYLSFGKRTKRFQRLNLSYGMGLKFLKREDEKKGIGFDVGLISHLKRFKIGCSLINFIASDVGRESDRVLVAGFLWRVSERFISAFSLKNRDCLFGTEIIKGEEYIRIGIEKKGISLGLGGDVFGFAVDWALSKGCHYLSIGFQY